MMKTNLMSGVQRNLLILGAVVTAAISFSACSKSSDGNSSSGEPVAGVMVVNLAADKASVGVSLSGSNLVNGLGYANFTGGYFAVYAGSWSIRSFDATAGTTMAETNSDLADSRYYSIFVTGANDTYRNIVVNDRFDTLSATNSKAYIRYINAVPDSAKPTITITGGGQTVINNSAAGFGTVSGFAAVDGGTVTITASNGGTIQATRTITVDQPKVYTVLLTGIPGINDTEKMVQIKYIENGSLSTTGQQNGTTTGITLAQ